MSGGIVVRDIYHLIALLEAQRAGHCLGTKYRVGQYIDEEPRTFHFSFILNWSYLTLKDAIRRGMVLMIDDEGDDS